jgi:SsrA-binding protein
MADRSRDRSKERAKDRVIASHRRASYDYELTDKYEAGLALLGSEVRMLREGSANLTDAWCAIEQGQATLKGLEIPVLQGAAFGHEPKRPRKLLLHAHEIEAIARAVDRDGMTVIATKLYFKEGRVKVELALARGRKKADKRNAVREKDAEREARQAMSRATRAGSRG